MLLSVVVVRNRTADILIAVEVIVLNIGHVVAVVVILHERAYVSLVVTKVVRSMMSVVVREVIPVIRRAPMCVHRTAETVKQRRAFVEHRLKDISRTVDIRRTDNLYVRRRETHLNNKRCYVLIDISSQNGLDKQHMGAAVKRLKHTQVIDVPVVVEVEIGDDV